MRRFLYLLLAVLMATGVGAWTNGAQAAADVAAPQTGKIVSDEPATNTPWILAKFDANKHNLATTYSIAKVGNAIVVGGEFDQVRNANTSSADNLFTRHNLFAFDATTGRVLPDFAPDPNQPVRKVLAAPDGQSVYVAGSFNQVAGQPTPGHIVKINVGTGLVDTTFNAPAITGKFGGDIRDLDVKGNHLFVAGKFNQIDTAPNAHAQAALASLDATTGAFDPYFNPVLAGLHNPGLASSVTDVLQMAVNPQNTELVAVGNFTTVDGQARSQIAKFDIGNAPAVVDPTGAVHQTLSPWSTTLFTQACSVNVETTMTDVEYSPSGTFFVASSTGAYGGAGSLNGVSGCDVVARFEENTAAGSRATWTAYTGGDTTWTVEVTDRVVYVGGHQRWQNNPGAADVAGPGAVSRPGIAALDTVNGLPFSWNPTRSRGVGVQDMLATSDGLYVGSDTELLGHTPGNTSHKRIAFLPLTGGKDLPAQQARRLPVNVYTVAAGGRQLQRRGGFNGTTAGSPVNMPNGPGWGLSRGAFMVNGVLYQVNSNGLMTKRTFTGTSYGSGSYVNASDALVTQTGWHNDAKSLSSLFYSDGFIYYTLPGVNALYYRSFEPEDDVVGEQRFSTTTSTINWGNARGAFVVDGKIYNGNSAGKLFAATWDPAAHAAVPNTSVALTAAGTGWNTRAMFPGQGPAPAN